MELVQLLVVKRILWASFDGTTLSAVPQLVNTKAWLSFITKTSISIVWAYAFQKIYIMHLSLIYARDLQLKKHHVFSINTTRTSGWCIQTVPDPFFADSHSKKKKKWSGHVRLPLGGALRGMSPKLDHYDWYRQMGMVVVLLCIVLITTKE